MVDIPANFDLGNGVRKDIARLHQSTKDLDSFFGPKVSLGSIITVDFKDQVSGRLRDDILSHLQDETTGHV